MKCLLQNPFWIMRKVNLNVIEKAPFMLHLSELYLTFRLMEQSNIDMT